MNKIRAICIDRDGTINIEKTYVHKMDDFEFIPGSLEALRLLTQHEVRTYIITNQAGIARGYYTEDQFHSKVEYATIVERYRREWVPSPILLSGNCFPNKESDITTTD